MNSGSGQMRGKGVAMVAKAGTGVHEVPNATIHSTLLADGQILEGATRPPTPSPPGPPVPKLKPDQWLAIDSFFSFSGTTMTVSSLPAGKDHTYLKKSEANSRTLPPSMLKSVTKGEKFALSCKPEALEGGYWLVTLR